MGWGFRFSKMCPPLFLQAWQGCPITARSWKGKCRQKKPGLSPREALLAPGRGMGLSLANARARCKLSIQVRLPGIASTCPPPPVSLGELRPVSNPAPLQPSPTRHPPPHNCNHHTGLLPATGHLQINRSLKTVGTPRTAPLRPRTPKGSLILTNRTGPDGSLTGLKESPADR